MERLGIPLKPPRNTKRLIALVEAWEPLLTIIIGIVLTLTFLFGASLFPHLLERMRNSVADLQIAALPNPGPSRTPLIVVVDEKSLARYGQWPWPRYRVAQLFEILARSGVAAVGVDTLFTERDRSSPTEMMRELHRGFDVDFPMDSIPSGVRDYDQILATALSTGPFVLSYFFEFDHPDGSHCRLKSANTALLIQEDQMAHPWQKLHRANGVLCSIPYLNDAAAAHGFINTRPDDDGIYRRTPLIMEWMGHIYPSLALQTLLNSRGIKQLVVSSTDEGFTLHLDDTKIPLDAAGNLLIRFRGPSRSYEYISALDVLEGPVNLERLRDRIVFFGVKATGLLEYRPTQYDALYTGVEFHAAIVDNILAADFLRRPATADTIEAGFALLFGIVLSVLLACGRPLISVAAFGVLVLGVVLASQTLLLTTGWVISPVLSVLTMFFVQLVLSLLKYERERLKSLSIRRQILASQEATIEGFCAMSEYRDPETGAHIKRTQNYVRALAENLRDHPRFRAYLDDNTIELMYKTAPLHDVGKIGVPDHILLKPGLLNDEEFELMKKHTEYGAQVFEIIQQRTGENDFLRTAIEIILGHQEKWDGTGYPRGVSGDAIPVSARLMALADVYDALISRRVYKPPYSHRTAVKMIADGSGTHFDPDVVDAFLKIEAEFKELALRYLDNEEQRESLLCEEEIEETRPKRVAHS